MKVVLLDIPYDPGARAMGMVMTCPAFLSLATTLDAAGVPVTVLDPEAEGLSIEAVAARLVALAPDIVGLPAPTHWVFRAMGLARLVKAVCPAARVVLGGLHPTMLPIEVLEVCPDVDYAVQGEGEQTLLDLVRALEHDRAADPRGVPGLWGRDPADRQAVVHGPPRELLPDLDALPFPAFDRIPVAANRAEMFTGPGPGFGLITSRGCLGRCRFCAEHRFWGGLWRPHGAERIAAEARTLRERYGRQHLLFADDDFLTDPARAAEILDRLGPAADGETVFLQTRAERIVEARDLLPTMRRAGVANILIGAEAPDDASLARLGKGQHTGTVREAADLLHAHEIGVWASMVWGAPWDDEDAARRTLAFAREIRADWFQLNLYTPVPGSPEFDRAQADGAITTHDWSRYTFGRAVLRHPSMSAEDLERTADRHFSAFWHDPDLDDPGKRPWAARPWIAWIAPFYRRVLSTRPAPAPLGPLGTRWARWADGYRDRTLRRYGET